ncbi:aldehyde dehydrogenase [Flavobacteria bacterium BBFL7]|nr:aldehyde dehydrogenase [Flavobacteria bacterium BBFL7]
MVDQQYIKLTHQSHQEFFKSQQTKDVNYRITALKKLKAVIEQKEQQVYKALAADLGKSEFEAFITEYQVITGELDKYIKKTKKWASPRKVRPSLLNFPSKARQYSEPYGNTLIISPWNYPFQLALAPLIGAVAAGNTVILKPSEFSTATSQLLEEIVNESFDAQHVKVIQGDADVAKELTSLKWDYIFFTGSPPVGKAIYQAAAKHLTPVTLELGGKNPCVIHESASLKVAARRIVWGKFLNAGQTCIAPDYILVHNSVKLEFIEHVKAEIINFFGKNPKESPDLPRIIREQHFRKLIEMLEDQKIISGGQHDINTLYIAPTLLDEPQRDSNVMQEEIFGPILPVISYKNQGDIIQWIDSYEKSLGAYIFSNNNRFEQWFIQRFSYGGGVINDSIVQFVNERLPFGGVGNSGIGNYHGKKTFETFSHMKSMVHRGTWLDIPIKYAPYSGKLDIVKRIIRWL